MEPVIDFRICSPEEFRAASPLERRKLVLAQVEADPRHHLQSVWIAETESCGTAACIAGWTSLLAGDRPYSSEGFTSYDAVICAETGHKSRIRTRAIELLGFDEAEGEAVVFGMTTPQAVDWLRRHVA